MTNYLITVSIYHSRSEQTGNALIEKVIAKYCIPGYVIMDQDSAFMSSLMNYLPQKLDIKIKKVAPNNNQSLQADHGIKSLSTILNKHLTDLGQMWPKYMPLVALAYNTFNTPNLSNYSPYELVFGRKPKLLLDLEINNVIKVSGTCKDYHTLLNKRLQYLHKLLQEFRSKRLAMINKGRNFFQYNSGAIVYIISLLTSQLGTSFQKVAIKHIGPLVVYKIIDPHNHLLMILDSKILRGLFRHERLNPAIIKISQGNVHNLPQLKQVINIGITI